MSHCPACSCLQRKGIPSDPNNTSLALTLHTSWSEAQSIKAACLEETDQSISSAGACFQSLKSSCADLSSSDSCQCHTYMLRSLPENSQTALFPTLLSATCQWIDLLALSLAGKSALATCFAVHAHKVVRRGQAVRVASAACVAPLPAAITCNHALPVIVARAAHAGHMPLLHPPCGGPQQPCHVGRLGQNCNCLDLGLLLFTVLLKRRAHDAMHNARHSSTFRLQVRAEPCGGAAPACLHGGARSVPCPCTVMTVLSGTLPILARGWSPCSRPSMSSTCARD